MTQTIAQKKDLYELDYLLWTQEIVAKLKAKDFNDLDIDNLIEEIEDLGRSQKQEALSRLATLLEHLLKRIYVDLPQEYNGWERTIREQRRQIKRAIKVSPSLVPYFDQIFDDAFEDALDEVRSEKGYNSVNFADRWQFSRELDAILSANFWELD